MEGDTNTAMLHTTFICARGLLYWSLLYFSPFGEGSVVAWVSQVRMAVTAFLRL